jgi:hypothetical protein
MSQNRHLRTRCPVAITIDLVGVSLLNVHCVIDLNTSNSVVVKKCVYTEILLRIFTVTSSFYGLLNVEPLINQNPVRENIKMSDELKMHVFTSSVHHTVCGSIGFNRSCSISVANE